MSLNSKFKELEKLDGDIYVVPEYEDPARYDSQEYNEFTSNYIWLVKINLKVWGFLQKIMLN